MKIQDVFDAKRGVYVIAEMGSNHNGSYDRAVRIMEGAAEAGADAVKMQYYRPEHMCLKSQAKLWDLYASSQLPDDWLKRLRRNAENLGIEFFVSVFSPDVIPFLEAEINPPAYKIAYFENQYESLIDACRKTGKYVLISTGPDYMPSPCDRNVAFLYCVSQYPARDNVGLDNIDWMKECELGPIGFSDHTLSCSAAAWAVSHGARILEKHVTMGMTDQGPDAGHSITVNEFGKYVKNARRAVISRTRDIAEIDDEGWQYRRSMWTTKDIKAGDVVDAGNAAFLRPAGGLERPAFGWRADHNLKAGNPIKEGDLC
jgi:pseudaminic acid synthase